MNSLSMIVAPLFKLAEHKTPLLWTNECEKSQRRLKSVLYSISILEYSNPNDKFILEAVIMAILSQIQNGEDSIIYQGKIYQ